MVDKTNIDENKCSAILFKCMQECAGLKYIAPQHIQGCINAVLHRKNFTVTKEENAYILERLSEALTYAFKNFIPGYSLNDEG